MNTMVNKTVTFTESEIEIVTDALNDYKRSIKKLLAQYPEHFTPKMTEYQQSVIDQVEKDILPLLEADDNF